MARKTVDGDLLMFLAHDSRVQTSNLSSGQSAYTEVGPRPGVFVPDDPDSLLEVQIHAAQANDIKTHVTVGGLPGPDGASIVWRNLPSGNAYGWNEPNFLEDVFVVSNLDGATSTNCYGWQELDAITDPDTQDVYVLGIGFSITPALPYPRVWKWTATTRTWSELGDIFSSDSDDAGALFLLGGRLHALIFDDEYAKVQVWDGSAWQRAHPGTAFVASASPDRARVIVDQFGRLACFYEASGRLMQAYSSDGGATWTKFGAGVATEGDKFDACLAGDGSIVVVSVLNSGSEPVRARRIGGASDDLTAVTEVELHDTGACEWVACACDADGTVYAFVADNNVAGRLAVFRSLDDGRTWTEYGSDALLQAAAAEDFPQQAAVTFSQGSAFLALRHSQDALSRAFGAAPNPQPLECLMLGGWSNMETTRSASGTVGRRTRDTWGTGSVALAQLATSDLRDHGGWTSAGTSPVGDGTGMLISLTASTGRIVEATTTTASDTWRQVKFRRISGSGVVYQQQRGSSSPYRYAWHVEVNADEFYLVDSEDSDIIATVEADMTKWIVLRVKMFGAGTIEEASWRYEDDTQWTDITLANEVLTDGGASASDHDAIGSHISCTLSARVLYLCRSNQLSIVSGSPGSGSGLQWGKALGADPYPIPDHGDGALSAALSLAGGPALYAETHECEAAYDYGVANLDERSPARPWRSTDTTQHTIAWNVGIADTWLQGSNLFGLYLDGCEQRQVQFIGRTFAGSETVLGTWDGAEGFTGLTYQRNGELIRPASGTLDGGRYIAPGELVGGTAYIDGYARRIVRNTGGYWTDDTSQQVCIWVEGLTGAETTPGDCEIWLPRGLLLVPVANAAQYRQYMVRITAAQDTHSGRYAIGALAMGAFLIPGKRPDRGLSWRQIPNSVRRSDEYGSDSYDQRGPPLRELTAAWNDGANEYRLETTIGDHLSAGTGAPGLATWGDVRHVLDSLVAQQQAGELPVVAYLGPIPSEPTMVTDRARMLYGACASPTQANRLVDRAHRVESITIRELV